MKISFLNPEIERLCKQSKLAACKLGSVSAKKLQRRLSELFAATVVAELVAGRPHPLQRDRAGQFSVDLQGGCRLIFKPTKQPPPIKADGSIDWAQIDEITIMDAVDYHD